MQSVKLYSRSKKYCAILTVLVFLFLFPGRVFDGGNGREEGMGWTVGRCNVQLQLRLNWMMMGGSERLELHFREGQGTSGQNRTEGNEGMYSDTGDN